MEEIRRMEDQLRRAFEGEAWHGPALREALAGVTAEQAAAKPLAGAHSVWEIVLHLITWHNAVRQRLEGEPLAVRAADDWPLSAAAHEAAWHETLRQLERSYQDLRRAVAGLPASRLDQPIADSRSSAYATIHGIIQHDLYHAGQIALLKKAWN